MCGGWKALSTLDGESRKGVRGAASGCDNAKATIRVKGATPNTSKSIVQHMIAIVRRYEEARSCSTYRV